MLGPVSPTTPAGRVATWLKQHPGQVLTPALAAKLLDAPARTLDELLLPALQAHLVVVANDAELGRIYRPGRLLAQWSTPQAQPATAAAGKKATSARTLKRLPQLDASHLQVRSGVALPPDRRYLRGHTKYDDVFARLTADGQAITGIGGEYASALMKAATAYVDHRPALKKASRLLVRRLADGTCGVWRLSVAEAAKASPASAAGNAGTTGKAK